MKILVAGATGVIGRSLLPILVREGHEVIGMTRNEASKSLISKLGASPLVADALERESMTHALREARPEVVIHQLTSLSNFNFEDNNRIRTIGTRNLVDASQAVGVRRMIAQSISWTYEPGDHPAKEEEPLDLEAPQPRKTTVDGVLALEQAAAEMPEYVILRYGMLYGPGTWFDRNGLMAEKVRHKELKATEGVTSFLHVEDAAQTAVAALEWPTGPVNVVDDEPAPGTEWLPFYAAAIGAPAPEVQEGSSRGERGAANAKARKDYGWKPLYPTWREGFPASLQT
ncbi:NAD(P)-dependent oxidoreductase [Paenibacillus sp. MZ04-78.2]|uniref:NAD-dependent epimerase/dehydratase family protein n=1 Tax=Paenibacillus sp. MZ04-78.2 TaxID=2962034 RepID=UPI0020B708C5|nr:NAD(P)-dependent oxidoreductase [Paenibacillus sp. MZ04-78.2]MCP3772178.1 NAD(P)-dependent oxidoreductase [Paenibacillus sp. MZ04-78.2]